MKKFVQIPGNAAFVSVEDIIHFYDDEDKNSPTLTIDFGDNEVEYQNASAKDLAWAIKKLEGSC